MKDISFQGKGLCESESLLFEKMNGGGGGFSKELTNGESDELKENHNLELVFLDASFTKGQTVTLSVPSYLIHVSQQGLTLYCKDQNGIKAPFNSKPLEKKEPKIEKTGSSFSLSSLFMACFCSFGAGAAVATYATISFLRK
jgi:hypothetical protein